MLCLLMKMKSPLFCQKSLNSQCANFKRITKHWLLKTCKYVYMTLNKLINTTYIKQFLGEWWQYSYYELHETAKAFKIYQDLYILKTLMYTILLHITDVSCIYIIKLLVLKNNSTLLWLALFSSTHHKSSVPCSASVSRNWWPSLCPCCHTPWLSSLKFRVRLLPCCEHH